ncbi:hypothetical protein QZH41_011086 [Actinostola sp. cb2023]|nr:hypothetical protein QZH41_011086 [Actinostola sp. cb2023]
MSKPAFIALCLVAFLATAKATETVTAMFTVKENYRNPKGVFYKSFDQQTMLSCGHACLQNPRCRATNFRSINNGDGVCEFVDVSPSEISRGLEFDEEWVFSHNLKDDCRFAICSNGGSCIYDANSDLYRCSCPALWTGDECQEIKVSKAVFNFTTLGYHGRRGPTDNKGYKDTILENTLVINGTQTWTAPVAGKYHVTACGAAGGDGTSGSKGGKGALVNRTAHLERGDVLKIMVGQKGETQGDGTVGGGGGGTFVVHYATQGNYKVIAVAGGGGGGGINMDGRHGRPRCDLNLGTGGEVCAENGATASGGGGGFRGNGTCYKSGICVNEACNGGGKAFVSGGEGGKGGSSCDGGFGGGGSCSNSPGGGGGYTGGKVILKVFSNGTRFSFAEGGCSYVPVPFDGVITTGYNSGDGYATLKLIP